MPRANRHYIPGCVWHITHRCHKQDFLLKFEKDRKRWRHWLYEAKKRYGLCVLNYIVTSNHTHLLVVDTGEQVIPKSLQLIAGRTAQEYNVRKNRTGAFWEDRYHATAIQTDDYLSRCLVYIDLNMVRAGVVRHPSEYSISGYNEIQTPSKRYQVVNQKALNDLFGIKEGQSFRKMHRGWVEHVLLNEGTKRQEFWSESVAVGGESFILDIQQKLAGRIPGRSIVTENEITVLNEPLAAYSTLFDAKKAPLSLKNTYFLDIK
ncbi:MAG: transposase [Desulfotalea sp.]|nr:MAG: transposase [Desulfotalea sp.]